MKRLIHFAPGESPGGRRANFPPTTRGGLNARLGTTLSEVLISLLVMGIGVVSLATLFPISVLRSIQATQLTNATIHRMNVEQLLEVYPQLLFDPNVNGNLAEHDFGPNSLDQGRFIVDPVGFTNPLLISGGVNATFGNGMAGPPNMINRYHGGFSSVNLATQAAYLGDTWQLSAKGFANGSSTTSITLPAGIDTTDFQSAASLTNYTNGVRVRVVIFSPDGKQSVVREHSPTALPLDLTNLPTISWPAANAVPWTTSSRFRLEIFDARYSWLLTVRKTPNSLYPAGDAHVDVVVFHKRAFSAASEQVFNVSPRVPQPANPPPNVVIGVSAGDTVMTLDLTATNAMTPPIKPFLKKGSFIFDMQNVHWYRIVQISGSSTNPVITFDKPALASIVSKVNGNFVPAIMAMPGIVEVYPIGTFSYDPNNPPQ